MISLAGTHCSPGMKNIRDMVAEHRAFSEIAMAERMRKGVDNGDMPKDIDCDMLAAYCSAVARGLAAQGEMGFAARSCRRSGGSRCGPGRRRTAEIGEGPPHRFG